MSSTYYAHLMHEVDREAERFVTALSHLVPSIASDQTDLIEGPLGETAREFGYELAARLLDADGAWLLAEAVGFAEVNDYDGPLRWLSLHISDEVLDRLGAHLKYILV